MGNAIIKVNNGEEDTFEVSPEGNVKIKGYIEATGGKIGPMTIE
jgi:hypothetical protein